MSSNNAHMFFLLSFFFHSFYAVCMRACALHDFDFWWCCCCCCCFDTEAAVRVQHIDECVLRIHICVLLLLLLLLRCYVSVFRSALAYINSVLVSLCVAFLFYFAPALIFGFISMCVYVLCYLLRSIGHHIFVACSFLFRFFPLSSSWMLHFLSLLCWIDVFCIFFSLEI